jgi:FtsP/CotA-like multicopper oxidase with cupredoxin domain
MVIDGWTAADPGNDGHPLNAIGPGGSFSYDFTVNQRACMNWYHPHPHGRTGEQVALGLSGAFIIRDAEEAGLPAGSPYEVPLVIRDTRLDKNGNLRYQAKKSGFEGNIALVNGTLDPELSVYREIYRFRVLNGANARIFHLALGNGADFRLIGNDGGLLASHVDLPEIVISPAERVDVLIDFSSLGDGDRVALRDLRSGWDLLEFVGNGNGNGGAMPSVSSTIAPLSGPVRTRQFAFEGMSRINGQEFAMNRVDFQVPHGETERWVFTTAGNAPHPVHVHASPFQIQSRSGGRGTVFPWEQGWKDTVLLEDGETVEILVRFDAPEVNGRYLMHCHKLEHEDAGMMLNFEVV